MSPSCPVCGGHQTEVVAEVPAVDGPPRTFSLVACRPCALRFAWPALSDEALAAYYPAPFYGKEGSLGLLVTRAFLRWRAGLVAAAGVGGGRLLDVGCGGGDFLAAMAERGFAVAGVEPSAAGRERAAARGFEVVADVAEAPAGPFEVVTLWQVLEHVRDPGRVLGEVTARLAPGGVVIVSVPNADGPEARAFGRHWFHLDLPRHQLHFSEAGLRRCVEAAGLVVQASTTASPEYNPFGLVQSAANRLGWDVNLYYRWLKRGEPLSAFPAPARRRAVAALPLLPAAMGAALVADRVLARSGRGATVTLTARWPGRQEAP